MAVSSSPKELVCLDPILVDLLVISGAVGSPVVFYCFEKVFSVWHFSVSVWH